MKIAIVDDLENDRNEIKELLLSFFHTYDMKTELCEFARGEDFLKAFVPEEYDLIFLDIYMGDLNGMEVAKQIAKVDPACYIIFLTTSPDYVMQGYDVRAWRYLLKPLTAKVLHNVLTPCIEQILHNKYFLNIKIDTMDMQIPFSKVLYATVVRRNIELYFQDKKITLSSKITFNEISNQLLADQRFLLCDKGTVVNLAWVKSIDEHLLTMKNGTTLMVSRRKLSDTKNAFLKYTIDHM